MESLLADEQVLYKGRLHWSIFIGVALIDLAAIGGCIILLVHKHGVPGIIVLVVGQLFVFPTLLRYVANTLVLTNKRVILTRGVTLKRSIDIALQKIEGVSVDQSLIGQVFNYGTIIIRGTGGGLEQFPLLAAPAEFSKALHQQIGIR